MQIAIDHLTKMQPGYICVAGIDVKKGQHVRPVLGRRLQDITAERYGGVFAIGDVIEIGKTTHVGTAPELEDYEFNTSNLAYVDTMTPADYWKLINMMSQSCLEDIFGKHLQQRGLSYAVLEGNGTASLGCLLPNRKPTLYINSWGRLCVSIDNNGFSAQVKVNDLRLHKRDGTINQRVVKAAIAKVDSGEELILSVGLARAFQSQNDTHRRHWLQINNIHFADDPTWSSL